MQRLLVVWLRVPRHWKAFYIAFPLSLLVLVGGFERDFAVLVAFVWAAMIAAAVWGSEKLKQRQRDRGGRRPRDRYDR